MGGLYFTFGRLIGDADTIALALIQKWVGPDDRGNRIEIVGYDNIQFTKAENILRGMGLEHLSKNEKALKELTDKGMAPN